MYIPTSPRAEGHRRTSRSTISRFYSEILHFLLEARHHVGKVHPRRPGFFRKFVVWRPPRLGFNDITNRRYTVLSLRTKEGSLTLHTPHDPFASYIQSNVRDSYRPPALRLHLIGCGKVGWNVLWPNRPTPLSHVLPFPL